MDEEVPNSYRQVRLAKLVPSAEGGIITEAESSKLMRQGILRSSHYLWLAEQYLMDMSKLGAGVELEAKLVLLSEVSAYMETLLNRLYKS